MVISDKRRSVIVATANEFFNIAVQSELQSEENVCLEKFFNEGKCRTLCISNSSGRLKLSSDLLKAKNSLVFFKTSESTVTNENFYDLVQITSIGKNGATDLIESLRQVWTQVLKNFNLDSVVLKKFENDLLGRNLGSSLVEEENFMGGQANRAKSSEEKNNFEKAVQYLKYIRREIETAAVNRDGLAGLEDSLESISGFLDDLWKLKGPVYNEDRMRRLFDIVDNDVYHLVQDLICQVKEEDRARDEALALSATICDKWITTCERQTGLFWANQPTHSWSGKPFKPEKSSILASRLSEIYAIRVQNRQLERLLTVNEKSALGLDAVFKNFDDFQGIIVDQSETEWNKLKNKVHSNLAPAEERVAAKLKSQIIEAKTPAALETEFRRYSELFKRENIGKLLRAERQSFLSTYIDLIDSYQSGIDAEGLLDSPEILQKVQAARVAELQLESLHTLGKEILSDLSGFADVSFKLSAAVKEAESQRQELTETWVTKTKKAIGSNELSLSKDSAVVELTGTQMMKVNFDSRLTTLIREARGLSSQGVELPRDIKDLVERASALTGRARALQQIANFHNTIGDRMAPSQRPLMLTTALELASAVREQSGVVWSDPRAVDAYTNRLRELVKKFGRQNSELAAKHSSLRDMVVNLLKGDNLNLVNNQNAWKETLKNMRAIVDSVEISYGNTKAWKLHWDRQLLKALGVAYRAALPTLIRKLPELRVEITYRDEYLQWRPPFEDIRMKLYSGLRRFLVIPVNFRGVGDQVDGRFQTIVTKSAHLFGGVYKEAEVLLDALEQYRLKWLPMVASGKLDINEKLKGKEPEVWDRAFKEAKQWAQELGKLKAAEVKICCVVIETSTIRSDLESLSRRHWEHLVLELRAEATSRLVTVSDFISLSTKKLSQRAHTIEEIGTSFEAYNEIKNQSKGIVKEIQDVTGLGKVLTAWTRERLDGLSNTRTAWENLKSRLDNYNDVMVHQLEEAKLNLKHQVLALQDEQERWNVKWSSKPEVITKDWLEHMRESWKNLLNQRASLVKDCQRLQIAKEDVIVIDEENDLRMEAEIEAEELNSTFQNEFLEELKKHEDEEWVVARKRLPKFHDWLDSWDNRLQLHMSKPDSLTVGEKVNLENDSYIGRKIRELRKTAESIQILKSDDLVDEHWQEIKEILKLNTLKRMSDLVLGNLLNSAHLIEDNSGKIKEITKRAAAESGIRQALSELETWESYSSLPLQEAKDSKNNTIYLVGDYSNLLERAGELRLILEGARGATGYERFASKASRCEASLHELEERVKILSIVQRKWVYLEPVYGSGAAPTDSGRWTRADKEFRFFIGEIAKDPRIPSIKNLPHQTLLNLRDLMDKCQRSLDDFLETKRSQYPRLYFLSDEDLLELVSSKAKGFDTHVSKLYQGIGSLEKQDNRITCVLSPEGEKLDLIHSVDLGEIFPKWLLSLEESIRNSLYASLNKCLTDSTPDVLAYTTQILLLAERIRFTKHCEFAIQEDSSGLRALFESLENQRKKYRSLEDTNDELMSLKIKNLLLETVHHLQVVRNLLDAQDREKLLWTWNRQIRTYKENEKVIIKCSAAEFPYCFEYQGAAIGLVRTPLTEKCYFALTQAMKLGLGGSPTGPAGTGKTETVKALGSILGRRVLVFNCDEGMDAGSMRRIFSGLAQAGAWGCFDEFNRLDEDTLSAVGMLIRPLQEAIRDKASTVDLGGLKITVNPHCCLFITMNPAGSDYGGRRKLPDSLARLFRPIAMAKPNKNNIIKSLLECDGFASAATLASKLVETFNTADKLLSRQSHYDWGLRALISVLSVVPSPTVENDEVKRIMTGIAASTMSKLVANDLVNFKNLLKDIFCSNDVSNLSFPTAKDSLKSELKKISDTENIPNDVINRCLQLNDQMTGRSGVAIVGPPGSGKSFVIKVLADTLSKSGSGIKIFNIYPNAITKVKLLGSVDVRTREFKDGLFSNIISNNENLSLWIVLNGDVDPCWAESLNSALDDNRILTLPNGVGIKLDSQTRFIFETHELSKASPATVSRLGIVCLGNPFASQFVDSQLFSELPSNLKARLHSRLSSLIEQAVKIKHKQKSVSGFLNSIMIHLKKFVSEAHLAFSLLISICGQIEPVSSREGLAKHIYELMQIQSPDPENVYDVLYNENLDLLEPFADEYKIMNTEDGNIFLAGNIQRGMMALLPWIRSGYPILLSGPLCSGKNSLLSAILHCLKSEETILIMKQSALCGAQNLINRLKRSCIMIDSTTESRTYKPKNGSRLVLVIEDIHLGTDSFQDQIRQFLQEGGFYEDDLEFARLPLTIICTSDVSSKIHPRLDSLLASHYLQIQKSKDIESIIELHLNESVKFDDSLKSWVTRMASIIFEAYRALTTEEDRVKFSLTELMMWIESLKYYPKSDNEGHQTNYLTDASKRLFKSKLTAKQHLRFNSIIASNVAKKAEEEDTFHVWKGKNDGLSELSENQWLNEIDNALNKFKREGEIVQDTVTSSLLELTAGVSWALGCENRGIVLSGRPGAGRKTATKIVSMICSVNLIDSGPGKAFASVKTAVQSAAIDGELTLLLIEEHHLREESFTILADAIVTKGELPGVYTSEELDGILSRLSDLASNDEFSGTLENFLYFRIKKYLRLIIIIDSHDIKGEYLLKTGLIRHCAHITGQNKGSEWWKSERLLMQTATMSEKSSEKLDPEMSGLKELVNAHLMAPSQQQSPSKFLALLDKWKFLRQKWLEEIEIKLKTLRAGIDRLKEAGDHVSSLEEDANRQRQQLEIEKGKANTALEKITATMRGATGQRGEMTTLKAETEKESLEVARRKKEIERELGKVEPLVEQASQAVAGISSDALAEVRSLRAPPAPVRDVLEGVLRLMGIQDTSWNSMKTFLAKRGVKDEIRNWDARRSTAQSLEAVEKLITERAQSFEEKTAKRASIAAAPLAAWVLANLQYGKILQQVAPLEREQRNLSQRLLAAEEQIGKLEAGLNTVESRVAQLQEELAAHSRGAAELQLRTEATEASLATARKLLTKLGVEYKEWDKECQILTEKKIRIGVDAANAAFFLIYQDPSKNDEWKKQVFDLLISERDKLQWRAQSLPSDTESLVGAVRTLRGSLTPLLIDPSGVAVNWLKNNMGSKLEVTRTNDTRFLTSIELAVRFGKPLLIEEIDILPAVLLPLLKKKPLRLGERSLPLIEGFQLFLATRQEFLKDVPSEADAILMKIALGVGTKSLVERLVEKAILQETPEVEVQRKNGLEREEKLSGEIDAARLELLTQLGASKSQDILQESQDQSGGGLLATLELTQAKANEISKSLDESRRNLAEITKRCQEHERLAKFTAIFYKPVKSFAQLSCLYVFTAETVTEKFLEAESTRRDLQHLNKEEREKTLERTLVRLILHHCINAVYRKHKLSLAIHLAMSLSRLPEDQKNLFMSGEGAMIKSNSGNQDVPKFVPEEKAQAVRALFNAQPQMRQKIHSSWMSDPNNIYANEDLSSFEKILTIQALHPECLHSALSKWAAGQLGVRSLVPPAWTLKQIAESGNKQPVLLLLAPGTDPGPELNSLVANKLIAAGGFVEVSLGQGHVAQAETALENACRSGSWILLSNLQLALNWLPRLDSILRSPVCTTQKHSNTKIWLTTEECSGFYQGLSGLCLKLAYEPPEGVKRNVKQSLLQLRQRQPPLRDQGTMLLISWLHAILQERRKFVPQGWIKPYAWSEADLDAACELVVKKNHNSTDKRSALSYASGNSDDWEADRGILEVAIYGGLVQDEYDMRVLRALLREIWSRDVYGGKKKLGGLMSLPKAAENPLVAVDRLDDADSLQNYFGLPANAQRAWEKAAAESTTNDLKEIVRRNASGTKDLFESKANISRIAKELKTLIDQQGFDAKNSRDKANLEEEEPLKRFVNVETETTKRLIRFVRSDLDNLSSKGDLKTPIKWLNEWNSGPREIVPFVKQLITRYQLLSSLVDVTSGVELSWFSRPDAFLAALKQHTARETGRPFEMLRLRAKWNENGHKGDMWKLSIVVSGLLLTGARMDNGILEEVTPTSNSVAMAPNCRLAYIDDQHFKDESDIEQSSLQVPVYADAFRSHLVCSLPVRYHDEQRDAWLQRGISFHLRST